MVEKFKQSWNKFFFEPTSPATIGLFRIALGVVAFLSTLGRYPIRDTFYTDLGVVKYHSLDIAFPPYPWLYFRWLPDSEPMLQYFFIGLLIVTAMFTLGLFTRISSILLFLGTI